LEKIMQTKLVRIGNSQGVRLSKTVIEQAHLGEMLDIAVRGDAVIIRPARNLRSGWAEAAATCHAGGDDKLSEWDTTTGDFDGDWA
jgi:antitoxin MazE